MKLIKAASLMLLMFLLSACGGRAQALEETGIMFSKVSAAHLKTDNGADDIDLPPDEVVIDLTPPEGMTFSRLNGLWISEEAALRRPFVIVFGNDTNALPQMGLTQASIIYEVLAEGSITRVAGVFQDFDASMIGPVRSSRQYLMEIAAEFGAVFVHHGSSPSGYIALRGYRTGSVDGMSYDGTTFWRDPVRRANRGSEHSSFTSVSNLLANVTQRSFNMDAPADLGMFKFFDVLTNPASASSSVSSGNAALTANVFAHENNVSVFRYNDEDGLYYKDAYGNPHMDEYADEQIAVSNVIVQITNVNVIPNDPEGRRNVALVGSGEGYLITGGGYSKIRWEKDNLNSATRWFNASGEPLTVNRGKTWITITGLMPTFE
jgi:hypothetical protein